MEQDLERESGSKIERRKYYEVDFKPNPIKLTYEVEVCTQLYTMKCPHL